MSKSAPTVELEPDCKSCAAYCCVALAFDHSDMFAYDKPAAEPCRNLNQSHRCKIHQSLDQKGFAGCVRYNCFGAGQRVTQELYNGRSWRDHPPDAKEMFDHFHLMQKLHEQLAMLKAARALPLTRPQMSQIERFESNLSPSDSWTINELKNFEATTIFDEMSSFFLSLRDAI